MPTSIRFDPEGSISSISALIETSLSRAHKGDGLMLLACDANGISPEFIDPVLKQSKTPIFGGIFPSIIYEKKAFNRGAIAVTLPLASETFFIPIVEEEENTFDENIERIFGNAEIGKTMAVFVDAQAPRISAFIEGLFNVFGLDLHYVGGGAGSISMLRKPCLFTNQGMKSDGAIIAPLKCDSGVGVCHGWKVLSGPYQVTEAHNNIIKTINWRTAFEVYAEALAPYCVGALDEHNIFQVAKAFPFGIARLGAERLVRVPISVVAHGALACAGDVPEGSFVHLLHGNEQSLIEAAAEALERAQHARPSLKKKDIHLLFDCISRMLFLGSRFREELEAVCPEDLPLIGACTIGEIASSGTDYLEYLNKTVVLALLENI
jgi:hypothetical protein